MRRLIVIALLCGACDLEERDDFLIGRECEPEVSESCDPGQRCLPHLYDGLRPDDFRCRDRASFDPLGDGKEPPLAYCNETYPCPGDLECRPDRVRMDAGLRHTICQRPGAPFGPPP